MTSQTERSAWFKRTEYDRSDSATRSQLLEAAERVFADAGYAKASVARIADEAGVARATFYVYFTSRQEAFQVLTEDLIAGVREAQRARSVDATDPRAVIASSIRVILELYVSRTGLLSVIEQQSKLDDEVSRLWASFWSSQTRNSERFIARLQSEGRADPDVDPAVASESISAVILHYGLRNPSATSERLDELGGMIAPVYERLIGLRPS